MKRPPTDTARPRPTTSRRRPNRPSRTPQRLAILAGLLFPVLVTFAPVTPASAAFGPFQWQGGVTPATPVAYAGDPSWDVSIHRRATGDSMDAIAAQHGADCRGYEDAGGTPQAGGTHVVTTLADSVYICNNHLMTSAGDGGYAQTTMTPNQIVDFSNGTATIKFNLSTRHINSRDWLSFWLTPFAENVMHPFTDAVDLQGPPKDGVAIDGGVGTGAGSTGYAALVVSNFQFNAYTELSRGGTVESVLAAHGLAPSSNRRDTFELDISTTHIRFGMPAYNAWFVDNDFLAPLSFNQAIFQLNHDSYDACKGQAISITNPCTSDTWHWSDVSISPSIAFDNNRIAQKSVHAGADTVVLDHPAGSSSFLRFESLAATGTTQVSFNGAPLQTATRQMINGDKGQIHDDHFSPYWMQIPAGTTTIRFFGQNFYAGQWWVRDPAVWDRGVQPAPAPAPSPSPTPTPSSVPTPSSAPTPSPSPSSPPIPINNMPCVVTMNGTQQPGTCSGTFLHG
jgi:hypothetical protein